jgi:hypothetical protein
MSSASSENQLMDYVSFIQFERIEKNIIRALEGHCTWTYYDGLDMLGYQGSCI